MSAERGRVGRWVDGLGLGELHTLGWAWVAVLAWCWLLRQLAGPGLMVLGVWLVLGLALVGLGRTANRERRLLLWAVVHAGAHVGWMSGQLAGFALVPVVVAALAASVAVSVLARRAPAAAWFAWVVTVLAVAASCGRLLGGAS
ncbi:hypothetical protein [Cellulomonas sp. RIT-PI-Y]|uniref:hypothetical protein n=1 Tax=Cellulomonas sp. RIT-PI-Y TaxID=3035297 RepID=UPI0021D868ED|nr:hypothetical protein [Cellulomonas sp. RIT-PI-Y]